MTTATEPSLQELSPQIQKLIARHQAYEAVSSQWNYLSYKPNPEDNPHWAQCRATDLEWNYDIDRYSRNLWTHQKSERYRTSSTIGGRANDSRSPTRNWGSPTKPSPRRTRSTSIGERINLSSPLKKNPDNSTRKQIDAPCNSYRTPRGNKEKLITPKSEKKVLDDLYEIYQSSKNDGGNSSRQAEKITKASPHQTPERIMFASPSGASERRKMNKNPVKWEDEEQAQLTKTLDIKYYDGNEGVYNDSASQLSQNTNRGELKEDSSQDSQAQSMKRRSRDERKKLKEEKMKSTAIAMGEFGGVQESQEHLIRKVLGEDSVGELSSVASKSEKNKERRLRKDRTKKNETDKDDNNQESEELASQFRTIEYNRSHEIETRKDRSMIRSLPNETLGGQNREKLVNLDMQDNSQKKSNTQKVSKLTKDLDQNEEGIFNQERDVSGQSSEKLLENSDLEAQKKRSPVKASGISPDRNLINPGSEEFVADTHKNSNIIPGRNTENEEEKNEASLDGYQDNGEIEKESIDIHVWSAKKEMSFEEYLKSHRKEEAIRSPTVYSQREDTENDISASGQEYYKTESDPDLSTKKDFLSPNRGQGFLGLRLPIDESRSFIDTDKDWGSSAAKEDGKEGCDSNFQKAIQGSSQFVFDPSQQTASVRPGESELSQEEFVSSNKCAEKEEQSKGQSFKRKMRLEYKREDSSQEANDWQEDDQELKNFLEIENHVLKNEEKGKVKSKSKPQAFESLQVEVQEYENNNSEDGSLDHGMERVIVNLMNKFNDQEDMDRERKSLESNGKSWNGEEGHNVSPALFEKIMRSKQEDDQRLVGSHNTPAIKKDKNREFEEILLEILPVAESIKLEQTKKKANQSKAYSLENKAEQSELNKKDIYQKEREKTMQLDRKRVSKETIFDTEITWEKLQLFRKVEQNAATKIQDFCVQKSKKIERVEEKNINGHNDSKKEFQALIETMKNHENLYKQMKGLVGDKGDDVINLSLAFISAYCSLKTGKHNF